MNSIIIPKKERKNSIVVALMGQPNVGKSTIYNQLTGSIQHIGNWPGKTVEISWSKVKYNGNNIIIVDLPGTYSLSGFTEEEEIAVDFIMKEKPDVVVVITDVSALARNLYLLLQVLEITENVILVVNMLDEAKRWGIRVDLKELSKIFGIPVVGTIATKGVGVRDILKYSLEIAKNPQRPIKLDYGELEKYIKRIENLIKSVYKKSSRYFAIRILEGNKKILNSLPENIKKDVISVLNEIKEAFKKDSSILIASIRYKIIDDTLLKVIKKEGIAKDLTDKIDKIFFKKGLDILLSFLIIFLIFFIAYQIGSWLSEGISRIFEGIIGEKISPILYKILPTILADFIENGLINSLIFIVSLFPLIFSFTFFLSLIENLGVFARISLALDRIFSIFDASGKIFFPLVMGLACNVISVSTSRIIKSRKEKMRLLIVSQFIQCPARQVVIAAIIGLIFKPLLASIIFSAYIIFGFIIALLLFRFFKVFEGKARYPLIIELPPYRLPSLKILLKIAFVRSFEFIKRAGLLIIATNIIFWLLLKFPPNASIENSLLGLIGKIISPIFYPLGLNWKESIALLSGIMAKEVTIGTLNFLYGSVKNFVNSINLPSIMAFLTIYSYYIPCIATISAIKSESKDIKTTILAIFVSTSVSLILGYLVYFLINILL